MPYGMNSGTNNFIVLARIATNLIEFSRLSNNFAFRQQCLGLAEALLSLRAKEWHKNILARNERLERVSGFIVLCKNLGLINTEQANSVIRDLKSLELGVFNELITIKPKSKTISTKTFDASPKNTPESIKQRIYELISSKGQLSASLIRANFKDISHRTLLRYLAELVSSKTVKKIGGGRSVYYSIS